MIHAAVPALRGQAVSRRQQVQLVEQIRHRDSTSAFGALRKSASGRQQPAMTRMTLTGHRSGQHSRIRALRSYLAGSSGSLRADAGKLDHLGPFLGLVANELTKIGGRARKHRTATLSETPP